MTDQTVVRRIDFVEALEASENFALACHPSTSPSIEEDDRNFYPGFSPRLSPKRTRMTPALDDRAKPPVKNMQITALLNREMDVSFHYPLCASETSFI